MTAALVMVCEWSVGEARDGPEADLVANKLTRGGHIRKINWILGEGEQRQTQQTGTRRRNLTGIRGRQLNEQDGYRKIVMNCLGLASAFRLSA